MKKPTIKTLPSGLRVLLVDRPLSPTVTVSVLVHTGSEYERDGERGLSHFLEHMCFKGTERRPSSKDINRELDTLGALSNAFTGQEYTGYWAKATPSKVVSIIDILGDIVAHSVFPDTEIEKERGVIIEEINMYEEMHGHKTIESLIALMYQDQPAGRPILGTKDSVTSFTRSDFLKYHTSKYHSANTVVVVSGAFDQSVVMKSIRTAFKDLPVRAVALKKKVTTKQSETRISVINRTIDQAHLALGFHALPLGHKDQRALQLMVAVLASGMSSRLFHRLREDLGVAYYVEGGQQSFTDHGIIGISLGIDKTKLTEVITTIIQELVLLKTDLVPQVELDKSRDYILSMLRMGLETSDEIGGFYGAQCVLGQPIKTPEDITREFQKVTAKDVQAIAQKLFVAHNLSVALVGPFISSDMDSKLFHSL